MVCRMLKKFSLTNFKNFKNEIEIDFQNTLSYQFSTDCITDGLIGKMLIYGRNATGKTNLGKALMNIFYILFDISEYTKERDFLNADSEEEAAIFTYIFQIGKNELIYKYSQLSNQRLRDEELRIDGELIFCCDFIKKKYNFNNLEYIDAETAKKDRYVQLLNDADDTMDIVESNMPFLRWLVSNVALKNDSVIIKLANYVRRMMMVTVGNAILFSRRSRDNFYEFLEIPDKLQDLEEFLNAMGVECKLALEVLPDDHRELYMAHGRLIPFMVNASSGTLALVELYRRLFPKSYVPSLIYLDEFDAFFHYEMAENVIQFLKRRYPECQVIMTSHNTNLMTNRLMRPDCVFILSREGALTALCDATSRELREGHNLEKMYISGEFEQYE